MCRNTGGRRTAGRTLALALSSEELKMPVLHVRQVARCLGDMPQGAAGVTSTASAPKISTTPQFGCLAAAFVRRNGWGRTYTRWALTGASSSSSGIIEWRVTEQDRQKVRGSYRLRQAAQRGHKGRPLLCKSARSGRLVFPAIVH